MLGTLGFSTVGLIFLGCLFFPNILFGLRPPKDRVEFRENRLLLAFERSGQALCTLLVLIFDNFNYHGISPWSAWLGAAALLMALYLICWVRYFRGKHITADFLRPFLGIPLPLAVLPVAAVLCIAVYGKVIWLMIAGVILGIGHIGITAQHWRAYKQSSR